MGQEQSTGKAGGQRLVETTVRKTCYYELLGVERQASDDEIKKAYRKKALELHPDRNINDVENATKRFAEVQTAYEILSDPQERAWYDSHRDAILSGDSDAAGGASPQQSSAGTTPAAAIFAMMGRFNSSVPMTDEPNGFFGILNLFFDQLAAEETTAAEWDGAEVVDYPPFGRAKDDYDAVAKPFYRVWSSFSTKKSFSWRDKYRLSDAPDRRIRRLMEKENRKLREDGIREFNDAVQSFVAFVRKRDPRYVPNTQSEAERQQFLKNSAAAQAARSRAANQEKLAEFSIPEWAQSRNDGDLQGEFSSSEEESEVEHIECVVCDKIFKSENQFEAHEKSKKHVKAVQKLQRQMKKENAAFNLPKKEDLPHPESEPSSRDHSDVEERIIEGDTKPDREEEVEPEAEGETQPSSATEDDEYAPRSRVEERIMPGEVRTTNGTQKNGAPETPTDVDSTSASVNNLRLDDEAPAGKKIGKAKLKREKRAARQAAEADTQGVVSATT
ncbi:hypothetical protein QBC47DRAFT_43895 [Echria macrotheca]|uniref:J domain-containing protein n=1 Tax=Echria macrotheca TaxID=438768 RepID=A0AAJ0B860_9PEZI|nr:hypothetical protein QBC47DRAFT_43895 [Echria macrotheca]